MRAVAQYGTPYDGHGALLVGVFVVGHERLAGIVLGTANGLVVGREVHKFEALERHGRCRHIVARAKGYGEELGTGHEVHGIRAGKVDGIAQAHV